MMILQSKSAPPAVPAYSYGLAAPGAVYQQIQAGWGTINDTTLGGGRTMFDLTVTKATKGTISGTFDLTPEQVNLLKNGRLYIQIHNTNTPEGALEEFAWSPHAALGWSMLNQPRRAIFHFPGSRRPFGVGNTVGVQRRRSVLADPNGISKVTLTVCFARSPSRNPPTPFSEHVISICPRSGTLTMVGNLKWPSSCHR